MGNDQKRNLLWLDKIVNNDENKDYQKKLKKIKNIQLNTFCEIKDCIEKLKKIEFEKTYIIVSGSLSEKFFIELEKNIHIIKVIPEIIIFTSERKFEKVRQTITKLNINLMNINSIFFSYYNVENKLKADNTYTPKSSESDDSTKNDGAFTFEYINKLNDLVFPLYYTDFMDYPNKNEIYNFNIFLLDKYSKEEKFKNLIEQLLLKIRIPCDILAKYWLRAYTLESNFYKEMNDYLKYYNQKTSIL